MIVQELCLVPLGHDLLEGFPTPHGGREIADVVVVFMFSDIRPLNGLSAYLDWRTHGYLSRTIDSGTLSGARGTMIECSNIEDIPCKLLVVIGLGSIQEIHPEELLTWPRHIIKKCIDVEALTLAVDCPAQVCKIDEIKRFLEELHCCWQNPSSSNMESPVDEEKLDLGFDCESGPVTEHAILDTESSCRGENEGQAESMIPFVDPDDVLDIEPEPLSADTNLLLSHSPGEDLSSIRTNKHLTGIWVVVNPERIRELEARKGPSIAIRNPS